MYSNTLKYQNIMASIVDKLEFAEFSIEVYLLSVSKKTKWSLET